MIRKTMIQVMHNGKPVSIINYGWESAAFYANWMGSSENDDLMPKMHGASIDMTSQNLVNSDGILAVFNSLLNVLWIARFKHHYKVFKATLRKRSK